MDGSDTNPADCTSTVILARSMILGGDTCAFGADRDDAVPRIP